MVPKNRDILFTILLQLPRSRAFARSHPQFSEATRDEPLDVLRCKTKE